MMIMGEETQEAGAPGGNVAMAEVAITSTVGNSTSTGHGLEQVQGEGGSSSSHAADGEPAPSPPPGRWPLLDMTLY